MMKPDDLDAGEFVDRAISPFWKHVLLELLSILDSRPGAALGEPDCGEHLERLSNGRQPFGHRLLASANFPAAVASLLERPLGDFADADLAPIGLAPEHRATTAGDSVNELLY